MIFIVSLLFLNFFATANSQTHDHQNHTNLSRELRLDGGKKWVTDKSLRFNMSAIHQHIKINLPKIDDQKLTSEEYLLLSEKINSNIKNIFKTCRLPAKADAQLHIILVNMMRSNDILKSKTGTVEKNHAIHEILSAYKMYLEYFDHNARN
ncbi:MAG: hypothetical protein M9962_11045 [Oligoflexia bacterium]|nr:hypothetical protein [Oligoflexia bacterium]